MILKDIDREILTDIKNKIPNITKRKEALIKLFVFLYVRLGIFLIFAAPFLSLWSIFLAEKGISWILFLIMNLPIVNFTADAISFLYFSRSSK